jgi:DNA-binding CsgD family transcriptional regulator
MKSRERTGAFDAVIPDLYDALLQPRAWPDVLARLADAAGIDGVHFLFTDDAGRPVMSEISTQLAPEGHELYCRHFVAIDPRRKLLQTMPLGRLTLCQDTFDDNFVRRNEFYNEFYLPAGLRYCASVRPFREDGHEAVFGFVKKLGADAFDDRDVAALRMLLPHLRRVAQLQHRLAALQAKATPLSAALDRLASGLVIVDQTFRVRFVNRGGEDILRAGDGLLLRDDRLVAVETEIAKKLDRLIGEAAHCAAAGDPHKGGGGLSVARPSGRQALALLIAPLPPYSASRFWRAEPAVAIFITDPEIGPCDAARRFAQTFGLTPAEARLAAGLVAGDSLDKIAGNLGLSKHTLRAQLKALMSKTETRRQAELVRLLTAFAGAA